MPPNKGLASAENRSHRLARSSEASTELKIVMEPFLAKADLIAHETPG
jgi:hypothetical protein